MNFIKVFVDGAETAPDALTALKRCQEIRILEQSNLYDPNDETTLVAIHGKEYIFANNKIIINQSVIWQTAEELSTSYLAMFPVAKTVTDYICPNDNYENHAFSDGYIRRSGINSITVWSEDVGFMGKFSYTLMNIEGNNLSDIGYFISTDNNGGAYNKMYYYATNGGNVSAGNKWKSTTEYQFEVNK